ncbi:MAG TPA: hypothetical protein VJ972_15060 [Anaerolineales bacterium]|nr:hypothetical protein [Anaerolineales bacterium]
MYTKPLTRQAVVTSDHADDLSAIRRLLTAAAINSRYCMKLLHDPVQAVQDGFGGEQFHLSEMTLCLMAPIRAASLPDFIHRLNENLSYQLIPLDYTLADH